MKLLPLVVSSFLFVAACGEGAKAAANDAANLAHKAAEAAKNMPAAAAIASTWTDLSKTLAGITDGATAEKAKSGLATIVDTLKGQVGSLGGITKATEGLGGDVVKGITDQVKKLLANPDVAKAIGPVLEQLNGLVGGK
ncbi:MAG: hypothetical protein JNK78_11265 [Planctomycetes bacterium]|nr:hypothetical protein [Planctomycetota bacterium]